MTRFRSGRALNVLRILVIVTCASLMLAELPHQLLSRRPNTKYTLGYVVADSISAGIDQSPNWVEVYRRRYGTTLENLAKPAATLSGALKQTESIAPTNCLVVLEIGGNDLLGKAGPKEFEQDLKSLLTACRRPNRTLVMFELPLLPGQAALGRAQRTVAREYGVFLIPKRYFCKVLSAPGATTDGLHLSPIGSSLMANVIHELIGDLLTN